jgi:hypothetical protein
VPMTRSQMAFIRGVRGRVVMIRIPSALLGRAAEEVVDGLAHRDRIDLAERHRVLR